MQLERADAPGPTAALLLALAFPVVWGVREGLQRRKVSAMAVLGVVSTLLTGGIGLLKVDPFWLAVKEAAVPGLIGPGGAGLELDALAAHPHLRLQPADLRRRRAWNRPWPSVAPPCPSSCGCAAARSISPAPSSSPR
jgi:hypothetical protein